MERTRARGLRTRDIEDILSESDLEDFAPSDEDGGDPPFDISSANVFSEDSDEDVGEDELLIRETNHRGRGRQTHRRGRGLRPTRSRGNRHATSIEGPSTNGSTYTWTVGDFPAKTLIQSQPSYLIVDSTNFNKMDYFRQYINDDLVKLIVEKTNQTAVKNTGRSLNLDMFECYRYIGITLIMGSLNFSYLRMYWENKWRIEEIASHMSRNRFTQIRNSLKVVFDDDVTSEMRSKDKLWKVRPLINRMQLGCRAQEKQDNLCIDEMIIPFTGTCGIKQYCPGKPNPEGLKAFVLANTDGLICDFHVYEGSTTYPDYEDTRFGLGEKAVLTLTDSLVPGHTLYFDRYFTSEKLLDELNQKGIGCSGTVMKNRIPHASRPNIMDDRELKRNGRGSTQVLVRPDKQMALTKWYDNKPVVMLSSVEASDEADLCKRWCKQEKRYVLVNRPRVIRNYNMNMGGVDLADRMLAVCPYRYRTKNGLSVSYRT